MPNEVVIKDVDGNKVAIDGDRLKVDAQLEVGDIEIGAVEIKNYNSDNRVEVNSNNRLTTLNMGQLVPEEYDYIDFNYTDDDLTEIIYKTGGAGGSTVATLTIAYSGGKLNTITKS